MHYLARLFLAFAIAVFGASPALAAEDDPMARDLLILTDWFEGRFDNEEQVWFEQMQEYRGAESREFLRLHTIHRRVNMPALGDHVFYVEEYTNHDPTSIVRQRIVVFASDGENRRIRMRQGFFSDAASVAGAHLDPALVESLSQDDFFFMDECDVFWRREASQFRGMMEPNACVFGEGEDRRYAVHTMLLSHDKYWREDATYRVSDGSLFLGTQPDRPYELRRALPFECSIYFFANDQFEGQQVEGLSLHSQGGTASAVRESDGREFEVLMREKEYPYYESRPDFIYFSLRERGSERSIGFSVNDPDARVVGVRAESIGAFCNRVGYSFREPNAVLPNF